jgi:thiamine biosynthesis protein ThiI
VTKFLIRYGEIALKGDWVRRKFQDKLVANIQDYFFHERTQCIMRSERGRIFLDADDLVRASDILTRIFGITSFSRVETSRSRMEDIARLTAKQFRTKLGKGTSFAVRARRSGNHDYTSPELASHVGSALQDAFDDLRVDLSSPDVEVFIEVRDKEAFVFEGRTSGPGGMPLGTQGIVLALISSEEGVAGAWLMMKRGCKVHVAHSDKPELVEPLEKWDVHLRAHSLDSEPDLGPLVKETGSQGLAVVWKDRSLAQSIRSKPVFYPTIGLSRAELDELLGKIGA